MGDQQRLGVGLAGSDVQEMDALPVDLGDELGVGVEPRLCGAPVVLRAPVLGKFLQIAKRYAAGPPSARQLAGPAGAGEPVVQVVEVRLADLDAEKLNVFAYLFSSSAGLVPVKKAMNNGGRVLS